jgi:hypothetical protein
MDFHTHHYDFFYHLEGFIDLVQGDVDHLYDDVLLGCLQLYYTSHESLIEPRSEAQEMYQVVLDAVRKGLEVSTVLSPEDKVRFRQEVDQLKQDIVKISHAHLSQES